MDDLDAFLRERGYRAVPLAPNPMGHLEVAGAVNGHPVRLIVDSGASQTCIDSDRRDALELCHVSVDGAPSEPATGIGPQSVPVQIAVVQSLRLGEVELGPTAVGVIDLGHVNVVLREKGADAIDGVLGMGSLRARGAVIDVAGARLHVHASEPEAG